MWALTKFLIVYVVGGLTFIPLIILAVLVHAHFTFPVRDDLEQSNDEDVLLRPGDAADVIKAGTKGLDERFQPRSNQDSDVAAGYFAVYREYVPGGVNGKPLERTTPAGSTTISSPSPSVYQSMYRSLFDRKQTASPLDNKGAANKPPRKGGNVFYVVLRHSHLLLFDDTEMLEVRYVLSLAHHDVSIYGGGEDIPDGELFIKRNALCLTRKTDAGETLADGTTSKPFFLFAENTSDKEDFYFAMLKNQDRIPDALNNPPIPLQFDVKDMIALVQRLHSSEDHLQTRWLNALVGRIFLGLYKTRDVENFIRAKISKKISRVKKPSFLSGIVVRGIDMGEGAPYITNPRLKDLTVDGDCVIEADVRYTGNFRLEIAATARIDLGTRFKAREVNLLLAVVLKRIEGHIFVRVKPPPSNRIWMTFSQAPKIEMSIEPIVSSRQITYTVILRQIENRIKEVIAESIVMPYWDDIAFYSTEGKKWRGGIWVEERPKPMPQDVEEAAAEDGEVDEVEHIESENTSNAMEATEESVSVPIPDNPQSSSAYSRKGARSLFNLSNSKTSGSSTSVDTTKSIASDKPRAIRHGSFASASSPVLGTDVTNVDAFKPASLSEHYNATSAIAAISALSHPTSPAETPIGSPSRPSAFAKAGSESSISSNEHDSREKPIPYPTLETAADTPSSSAGLYSSRPASVSEASHHSDHTESRDDLSTRHSPTSSSVNSVNVAVHSQEQDLANSSMNHTNRRESASSSNLKSTNSHENPPTTPKRITLTAVANVAASAKRWGLNALQRNVEQVRESLAERDSNSLHATQPHISEPMGRGRPLPPPGMPLPRPDRKTPTAPIPVPRRKPLAPPVLPKRPERNNTQQSSSTSDHQSVHEASNHHTAETSSQKEESIKVLDKTPPLPQRRENLSTSSGSHNEIGSMDRPDEDGLLVVAAPPDSEPTTPLTESKPTYLPPWVDDDVEAEEADTSMGHS